MFVPQCSICKMIKAELETGGRSPLQERIANCRRWNPRGEMQSVIARDLGVGAVTMNKHVNYHQSPDAVEKRFEKSIEKKAHTHVEARQAIIDKGLELLEENKLKITASDVRAAARDASDIEERNKDRSVKIMELIWAYQAEGELPGPTTDFIEGSAEVVQD